MGLRSDRRRERIARAIAIISAIDRPWYPEGEGLHTPNDNRPSHKEPCSFHRGRNTTIREELNEDRDIYEDGNGMEEWINRNQ